MINDLAIKSSLGLDMKTYTVGIYIVILVLLLEIMAVHALFDCRALNSTNDLQNSVANLFRYKKCQPSFFGGISWPLYTCPYSCRSIFSNIMSVPQIAHIWPPPRNIPTALIKSYTLCGMIPTGDYYFTQKYSQSGRVLNWSKAYLNDFKKKIHRKLGFNYGSSQQSFYHAFEVWKPNGQGVVFGSEEPWAESLGLAYGAINMTTIEYSSIVSEDARLSSMKPHDAARMFLQRKFQKFDFGISYSSWEHSGLGRYGDPLNPWGDFEALRMASCIIKEGGILYLGVPTGADKLVWNAHRVYGLLRFPMLTANWLPVAVFGENGKLSSDIFLHLLTQTISEREQPLLVLQNIRSCPLDH